MTFDDNCIMHMGHLYFKVLMVPLLKMSWTSCAKCMHVLFTFLSIGFWRIWNSYKLPTCLFFVIFRWDEWSHLMLVVKFISNIPCKWNFINDCILLMMLYVFVVYIDTLKFSSLPPLPPLQPQSLSFDICWKYTTWHLANKKNKNILDLKHINVMSWLIPQITRIIFNSPFSMKDFHTNHNQYNWFGHNILRFVPIEFMNINVLFTKRWIL
jgi:hypothetical protein